MNHFESHGLKVDQSELHCELVEADKDHKAVSVLGQASDVNLQSQDRVAVWTVLEIGLDNFKADARIVHEMEVHFAAGQVVERHKEVGQSRRAHKSGALNVEGPAHTHGHVWAVDADELVDFFGHMEPG